MTEQELFEQIQRNLDDEIEKELASRRTLIRGQYQANGVQHVAEELGLAGYGRLPQNRKYAAATDPDARRELGALANACRTSKKNLVEVLEVIAQVIPGWLVERPPADAGRIDWPLDPGSKEKILNPFLPLPEENQATRNVTTTNR